MQRTAKVAKVPTVSPAGGMQVGGFAKNLNVEYTEERNRDDGYWSTSSSDDDSSTDHEAGTGNHETFKMTAAPAGEMHAENNQKSASSVQSRGGGGKSARGGGTHSHASVHAAYVKDQVQLQVLWATGKISEAEYDAACGAATTKKEKGAEAPRPGQGQHGGMSTTLKSHPSSEVKKTAAPPKTAAVFTPTAITGAANAAVGGGLPEDTTTEVAYQSTNREFRSLLDLFSKESASALPVVKTTSTGDEAAREQQIPAATGTTVIQPHVEKPAPTPMPSLKKLEAMEFEAAQTAWLQGDADVPFVADHEMVEAHKRAALRYASLQMENPTSAAYRAASSSDHRRSSNTGVNSSNAPLAPQQSDHTHEESYSGGDDDEEDISAALPTVGSLIQHHQLQQQYTERQGDKVQMYQHSAAALEDLVASDSFVRRIRLFLARHHRKMLGTKLARERGEFGHEDHDVYRRFVAEFEPMLMKAIHRGARAFATGNNDDHKRNNPTANMRRSGVTRGGVAYVADCTSSDSDTEEVRGDDYDDTVGRQNKKARDDAIAMDLDEEDFFDWIFGGDEEPSGQQGGGGGSSRLSFEAWEAVLAVLHFSCFVDLVDDFIAAEYGVEDRDQDSSSVTTKAAAKRGLPQQQQQNQQQSGFATSSSQSHATTSTPVLPTTTSTTRNATTGASSTPAQQVSPAKPPGIGRPTGHKSSLGVRGLVSGSSQAWSGESDSNRTTSGRSGVGSLPQGDVDARRPAPGSAPGTIRSNSKKR